MLAQDILMVRDENVDKGTKREAEFLYNIIKLAPSIITFGKYVDLDKKLLVNVALQTLTLLIAMLQTNSTMPE
ncbi:unnamed protein product [Allacma fusca]|uniref:Uncharacterized protein n=1 Tax=Allacma fusca TaxID=39272 RepID=A0A8J2L7E1_9HEXA|nr:unnamed protein product [Allacma fusca]